MTEQETPADLFEDTGRRIKNVASKMDVILFNVKMKNEADRKALIEDVVVLQCFHMAAYRQPSPILDGFIASLEDKSRKEQKDERRDTGSWFTPPYIAEQITRSVMEITIEKIKKDKKIKDKIAKILTHRIMDPAVGGGIFLVCAHDYLMTEILKINPDANLEELSGLVATKCLFGVDINPKAIEGCKLALHLNIAKWKLKKRIEEFANIATKNSGLPSDKCDRPEKPSSAPEPARGTSSTPKTTATNGNKRRAKRAVRTSPLQTGTEASDSALSSAPPPAASQDRKTTSSTKERNL